MTQAQNIAATAGAAPPSSDPSVSPIISSELLKQIADTFKGLAKDVTDPEFLGQIRLLLTDHGSVLQLQADGADAALLARAAQALRARELTFLHTPGYAASLRQDEFISIGSRILDSLFSYGSAVLGRAIDSLGAKLDGVVLLTVPPASAAAAVPAPAAPVS